MSSDRATEVSTPQPEASETISRKEAFLFWFKLGCISFGGPAGQIALMRQELVERRRWISERRFLHALNYCMLLPGPEAQQLATYLGWLMHRTWGGIVAGALFVLPSFFILVALSWIYVVYSDHAWVAGVFYGVKPAVAAIVLHAAYRMGARTLSNGWLWCIAFGSFVSMFLQIPFPLILAASATTGLIGSHVAPTAFSLLPRHVGQPGSTGTALIDDHTPRPKHTHFQWTGFAKVLLAGALLWVVPMGLLCFYYGWNHTLTQMSWYFTKAALLTFGGAYAVLPYVYQGAVGDYGWLTAAQMIDGLALGETTPGPLIMVVAFVGFVGGYVKAVFGPEYLFCAGLAAASLVTWFTFLPSFLFILAGGPVVESSTNHPRFTAALTAISAAVVGVILNLALLFARKTIWPEALEGSTDLMALTIAAAAAVALIGMRQSITKVISLSALAGFLVKAIG
jgi:chromate transporter